MNYKASVDVSFETNNTQGGANYAAIGARYQGGGSSHSITGDTVCAEILVRRRLAAAGQQ